MKRQDKWWVLIDGAFYNKTNAKWSANKQQY
jgi:hypothetical protein